MDQTIFRVDAFRDPEAEVWVATSKDVLGLTTEADTIESLAQKLRDMIPELIHLNEIVPLDYTGLIAFELISHRQKLTQIAS